MICAVLKGWHMSGWGFDDSGGFNRFVTIVLAFMV